MPDVSKQSFTTQQRLIGCLLAQVQELKEEHRALCSRKSDVSSASIRAVVFDADGTLLNSLPPHVAFCHEMNEKFNANLVLPDYHTPDLLGCRSITAVS